MNVGSSTSYRKDPKETTEWDDIQRKFGNLPALPTEAEPEPEPEPVDEYEGKTLDELDELEEDEFADSHFLEAYRARRIAELGRKDAKSKYGEVLPLVKADFVREVTEASRAGQWVLVLLTNTTVESRKIEELLAVIAERHPATKFMKIEATQCIENYPDRNVPTLLIYRNGELATQLVTITAMGGRSTTFEVVEWILARQVGCLDTDLEEDPRETEAARGGGFLKRYGP